MSSEALTFEFSINDFDFELLSIAPDLLQADRKMLEEAVHDYFNNGACQESCHLIVFYAACNMTAALSDDFSGLSQTIL